MAFGLIIIGDEILSGKRTDQHLPKVIELLSARGLQLAWAEYVGDDPGRITSTLKRTLQGSDTVFSTGGIGATPDDHTRQCAAAALGVPLALHPEAKLRIMERFVEMAREEGREPDYSDPGLANRFRMGEFPIDSSIIPNPYNKIPGFSIRAGEPDGHYFVPGFPVMAWPMIEWVLDTYYAHLFRQTPRLEKSVLVFGIAESTLTPLMEHIEQQFPLVRVFSLPSVGNAQIRRHIELGVKGDPMQVEAAFEKLIAGLDTFRAEYKNV